MRIAVRGFVGGVRQFEEITENAREDDIAALAERHVLRLLALPGGDHHMIEIESLDEPDPLTRFFRFGTDPGGMVQPIEVRPPGKWAN